MKPMINLFSKTLALALVPIAAHADGLAPDRAYIPLTAQHLNIDPTQFGRTDWNQLNPGVILAWEDRWLGLDYSVGAFKNSFDDTSAYLTTAKFWDLSPDLSAGLVVGLADYHANARFISTQIGTSGWVVTGGPQMIYKNAFLQIQPVPQTNGQLGAIVIGGLTFDLGD